MTRHLVEMDSDGNITLPDEIPTEMGLEEGDVLYLERRPNGFALIPAASVDVPQTEASAGRIESNSAQKPKSGSPP